MNKLTAGIFAGILTVVTVNAAHADIATTTYVEGAVTAAKSYADTQVGTLETALVTSGTKTVKHAEDAGALTAAATATAIAAVDSASDTKYATEKAVASAIAGVSGNLGTVTSDVANLKSQMTTAQTDISTLQTTTGTHTTEIGQLKIDVSTNADNIGTNTGNISTLQGVTKGYSGENAIKNAVDSKQDKANSEVKSDTAAATKSDGRNVIANSAEVNKNLVALDTAIGTINTTINNNKTAAETAISNLTGTGTGATEGNGMVKMVTQSNGVVTATRGLVAEADLATDLATKVNGKMDTATYNTATTVGDDAKIVSKVNSVKQNLEALGTAVDGVQALVGNMAVATQIENAINTYDSTNTTALGGKMNLATDAYQHPLAVDNKGQVVAGTITNSCETGKTCILLPNANGTYTYETLATEYTNK